MIHLHIFIVLENTWRRYGIPVCVTVQRRCGSAPPACWSAISTPPATIYDGPIQRCCAHLLRDIHDLQTIYPDDASVTQRAGAVQDTYRHATVLDHHHQPMRRLTTQLDLERRLLSICQAFLDDPRQPRASCADASNATSRACPALDAENSSSLWPSPRRHQTTTPPNAACATWSSVAKSAAAPAPSKASTPR